MIFIVKVEYQQAIPRRKSNNSKQYSGTADLHTSVSTAHHTEKEEQIYLNYQTKTSGCLNNHITFECKSARE